MKLSSTLAAGIVTASLILTACGQPATQQTQQQTSSQAEKTEEKVEQPAETEKPKEEKNTLLADAVWPDNEVTALAPKPEFKEPLKSVNDSDSTYSHIVSGNWDGVTQDEAAAYVQSLKDAGFTVDAHESSHSTSYSYMASNKDMTLDEDRVTVSVNYGEYGDKIGSKFDLHITLNRAMHQN